MVDNYNARRYFLLHITDKNNGTSLIKMTTIYCHWGGAPDAGDVTAFHEVSTASVIQVLDYLVEQFK
uniref:Uncharacterized protein n=1 Tax=viral metagenome TaxID=1070528 RepID=A0A6C0J797_9ZZZZ